MKKVTLFVVSMLVSLQVSAIPLPDFIVYGAASAQDQVAAYWRDQSVSSSDVSNGLYKLAIPMGTQVRHRKGDAVEIWINGVPTGQRVTIGDFGTAQRLDLQ
ncbi:MAG: hypothetical protein HN661_14760 [Gammaproteobacteria bacterium]|jgi:hypothetical protein|nr:hypothetical protein [Gammaproteobacteria bacterium]MBT5635334.1 hypothetical protein [Gammaproteobacteria bacterium]MBT7480753.1 hypothetical protein [Gammaproteobacteria bacterium]HIJ26101.1 hypothetical protein [Gammaproteobacteria bacterium]HIJ31656.1 hypothetical protein [Gammaproteobacteria bacterium]